MIAERLMAPQEYMPALEELGLKFLRVEEFGGIPHSVFEAPDGTHFLYPGTAVGDDSQIPIIPARKLPDLIEKAKKHVCKK